MPITFPNGHRFDFGCASGALGFDGDGWWFEQPWRWAGILRPEEFTIITKTLTFEPRKGNLVWHAPWRAVRPYRRSFVNAVGLTNPGYTKWINTAYLNIYKKGYKAIVSIAPETVQEAAEMAIAFNRTSIVGLQLNASCPNVNRPCSEWHVGELADAILKKSRHPLIVKLGVQDDYLAICKELDGKVVAIELINSVPFQMAFPGQKSPLASQGGVSGKAIIEHAREALAKVKAAGVQTPIISGGGIASLGEVLERERLGASGFVFGSVFMARPWLPNRIAASYRRLSSALATR